MFYKYNRLFAAFVCFSLLLTICTVQVFAGAAPEDPYLVMTPEDPKNAEENMMVGTLQERLTELGYYTEKVTLILDATTRFALYKFCQANGLAYDDAGVRQSVWNALMSQDAIPAEGSAEYTLILYGTVSDAVLALQTRLKELQYYDGLVLEPGAYDEDLQKAIYRFCEENSVSYDGSGITPALQELIYSDIAIPYPGTKDESSLLEKFKDYMMGDADLLFIVVPVFVVWIFIMFLVLIVVFLVIHLLQKRKAARRAKEEYEIGGGPKMSVSKKAAPPPLMEKQKIVRIQIDYQGRTWNLEKDASQPITIGREFADVQLDASDQRVSRKHCVLYFKGAILMLRDESRNGTYVNNTPFRKCTTPVQSGDCIVIGLHQIYLRF